MLEKASVKFSDEEKIKIDNVSKKITKVHNEKYRNEIIGRFLRDYNGNENEVYKLVSELYEWREKYGINNVLENPQFEEAYKIVTQYVLFKLHKKDKLNQPLSIVNCGPMVLKTIFQKVTVEQLFQTFFYYLELNMKIIREAEDSTGSDILSIVSILDLDGISLYAYMYKPGIKIFEKAVYIYEHYFAGYVGKVYLLNVPWIYKILWSIVSPMLSEANRNKVVIIKEYPELFQYFDEDVIPEKYGGKCNCENGGCIPMPNSVDNGSNNSNENTYHMDVKAGEMKDIKINVVSGDKISYNVVCDYYDIKFGIKLMTQEGKEIELLQSNRIDTSLEPFRGILAVEESGECVAVVDNSYSYFHSKSVFLDFFIECESPLSPTNDSSLFN